MDAVSVCVCRNATARIGWWSGGVVETEKITSGKLVVVGTPIGNLQDLAPRAVEALAKASLVAAEDTRRARALLSHLGLAKPLISYFDGNEQARAQELVHAISGGQVVALISESGMPLISDPGFRLVRACVEQGIAVEVVPGPCAALVALCASGLPSDEFHFVGFLPPRSGSRRTRLRALASERATVVLFETANRLVAVLSDALEILGDREGVVARELTRLHEQFLRGKLSDLLARCEQEPPRGQITMVIAGATPSEPTLEETDELDRVIRKALEAGATARDIYRVALRCKEIGGK